MGNARNVGQFGAKSVWAAVAPHTCIMDTQHLDDGKFKWIMDTSQLSKIRIIDMSLVVNAKTMDARAITDISFSCSDARS